MSKINPKDRERDAVKPASPLTHTGPAREPPSRRLKVKMCTSCLPLSLSLCLAPSSAPLPSPSSSMLQFGNYTKIIYSSRTSSPFDPRALSCRWRAGPKPLFSICGHSPLLLYTMYIRWWLTCQHFFLRALSVILETPVQIAWLLREGEWIHGITKNGLEEYNDDPDSTICFPTKHLIFINMLLTSVGLFHVLSDFLLFTF